MSFLRQPGPGLDALYNFEMLDPPRIDEQVTITAGINWAAALYISCGQGGMVVRFDPASNTVQRTRIAGADPRTGFPPNVAVVFEIKLVSVK